MKEIIANPLMWAEAQAEKHLLSNMDKIVDARKLGDTFFEDISKD